MSALGELLLQVFLEVFINGVLPTRGERFSRWWRDKTAIGRLRVLIGWLFWLLVFFLLASVVVAVVTHLFEKPV